MAAGETPQVQYQQGSQPRGKAAQQNALMVSVPQMSPTPGVDEAQQYQPQGEAEQFLFGPSHRPNEPITAGAPFGPGGAFTPTPETNQDFLARVAEQMRNTGPQSSETAKFISAVMKRAGKGL